MDHLEISPAQPQPKNRIGFVGFALSILGMVTLGLLSPVAFLVSLCGLANRPRKYAVAGTLLGVIGSVVLVVIGTVGYHVAVRGGQLFAEALVYSTTATVLPLIEASDEIEKYTRDHGTIPDLATGQRLIASFRDISNRPLSYDVDGRSYSVTSRGGDSKFSSEDDIRIAFNGTERRIVVSGRDGLFGTADDERSEPIPTAPRN